VVFAGTVKPPSLSDPGLERWTENWDPNPRSRQHYGMNRLRVSTRETRLFSAKRSFARERTREQRRKRRRPR
jgi:hypothetical protein